MDTGSETTTEFVWPPELIEAMVAEIDRGRELRSRLTWVPGKGWVKANPKSAIRGGVA